MDKLHWHVEVGEADQDCFKDEEVGVSCQEMVKTYLRTTSSLLDLERMMVVAYSLGSLTYCKLQLFIPICCSKMLIYRRIILLILCNVLLIPGLGLDMATGGAI